MYDLNWFSALFPQFANAVLNTVESSPEGVVLSAHSALARASCPTCGAFSARVHGRYLRRLRDVPLVGRPVQLSVEVRRFKCTEPSCPAATFVEQIPALTRPFARFTPVFEHWLVKLGLALAGNAGSRLASAIGAAVSRSTLLRRLRALPLPAVGGVRVLGVDDFALRKGVSYGTVLVDNERSEVLDLLPDRSGEVLSAWLADHPGPEVVCRDRDSAYSRAISQALPDAVQVADRWQCAMRRLVVSPAQPGRTGGRFLGPMAYPIRKR